MKKIYIIDASGYLFRAYFAIRNMTNSKGESTNAIYGFIRSIMKLFKDFTPDHVVAVFDGPDNSKSREALYEHYKAHRSSFPPDLGYQIEWAIHFCELMGIPMLNIAGVEADDTMGTVAKWAEKNHFLSYICTSDKDMCQLVNDHILILNTHKDNLILGSKEVEENFGVPPTKMVDYLAIVGDSSDNVPGIPGFGPKTAVMLLKELGSLDEILAHPEKVPGKKSDVVRQEKELALLSRKLVIIDTAVPIPDDPDFYALKTPQAALLKEFYGKFNFNTLIRELEETLPKVEAKAILPLVPEEETHYKLINDEASFHRLISDLKQHQEICFDLETTHWQAHKADLVGIGFCVKEGEARYVPLNGTIPPQTILKELKALFENPNHSFIAHDIKYNMLVLSKYNIDISNISFDTILASYLLNSHSRLHSLSNQVLEYFGKVKPGIETVIGKGKNEINMRDAAIEKVCAYCCEEADYTFRLKHLLEKQLKERNLLHLLIDLEIPLARVLTKMEKHGIHVDIPFLEQMSKEIGKQISHLENEIYQLAGENFNINSPKQLSQILFTKLGIHPPKKTATGLSTNAEVLESLQEAHPIATKLLEYRGLEKLRSTYVDALPIEVNSHTHRIHCNFNQTVAATGRLSCQDPNLQNIPVRTEIGRAIREAFRPEKKGWSFLAADYSQIELRLLAHISEDPNLLKAFQAHQDIHTHTASLIFNVPIEEVTKQQRYQAKTVNFGVIYGQQAFGLSQELGIDVKDASIFIEKYFERYPKVRDYVETHKKITRETGKSTTLFGRERSIPEIHSKNHMIRSAAERLAINTPLQGSAADLIKKAMIKLDQELTRLNFKSYMILQIHDELLFEALDEEIPALEKLVRKEMQEVIKLKIPLVVDIAIGKNWKEC